MKKILSIMLILSMLLVLSFSATAEDLSGKITFYFWDSLQKPIMQAVVDLFNQDYPNVKVELNDIPWADYWMKLQTSLPSENGPDVFWLNFAHANEYVPKGLVACLDDYVAADGTDLSVFPESLINAYSRDGKLYGIPKDYDTIGLFYYKPVFDAAGVAYPTNDWTWTDLYDAAKAITEADVGYTGIALSLDDTQAVWFDAIATSGVSVVTEDGTRYNWNQEEIVDAGDFLMGIINEGYSPNYQQLQEISAGDRFSAGMVGMIFAGDWNSRTFMDALGSENIGVVEWPAKVKEGNIIHGLGVSIAENSPNKDIAWAFVKYFATYEAAVAQKDFVIPAHNEGSQTWVENFADLDDANNFLVAAQNYASGYPIATEQTSAQDDIVSNYLQKVWSGEMTPADAFAAIDEEISALFA